MIQFRFRLFQALSFLFIAVSISHCLLAVVHASPIVKSTALHERGQMMTKLPVDPPRMVLGYAYIRSRFIEEVGTQKVLKSETVIMPSTRNRHISRYDPGEYYQLQITVDPKVFNKLQPVYHQKQYANPDSKSTIIVQKSHSVYGKPKSLDDLALWAKPNSYFTRDGTALTFYVESVVLADVPNTDEGWILHSDENADWHLWVNKIKNLPFMLDEH
ncbi:hypothetical protein C8J55DRAFT_495246 [Lentinula edodes]|uniref:Uncharacterized protein n=1 Tax=Lentinula lateritia TaxID=40482 RepID=A0A9W9E1J6_9AGAR|nr:hypothetical protein C8J55DRAFT_495246 [Lentinula edodes]